MKFTRREFGKVALAALPACVLRPAGLIASGLAVKPSSRWSGVQVGMNVPYSFGSRTMSAGQTLAKTVALGISAVELRSQPVELAMGASLSALDPAHGKEVQAAAALREWRLKTAPVRAADLRTQYEDAGVKIEILKFDGIYDFDDPEMDYAFELARAVGARAISCELEVAGSERVGRFADKHALMVGYHGHTKTTAAMFDEACHYAVHNGINLDIGHFVAGGLGSPIDFIKARHDRITHIHVKDRKKNEGPNVPYGTGDTPVKEVLRLLRDNRWTGIQATIEYEMEVPPGSDRMTEIGKCVQYCKTALLS